MTACGAVCGCHDGCLMVCTFERAHVPPCDWWPGKPGLTWSNDTEHGFDASSMEGTTRVVPAVRQHPGTVADPSSPGADNG